MSVPRPHGNMGRVSEFADRDQWSQTESFAPRSRVFKCLSGVLVYSEDLTFIIFYSVA